MFQSAMAVPICTLTDTATTNGLGNFWFNDMKESTFSLKIEKDVNLGDIPLS